MAHFYGMHGKLQDITGEYFRMTQEASDTRTLETRAVVLIQSAFRASVVRARFHHVVDACSIVQRAARALAARAHVKILRQERQRKETLLFFHHCAAVIQKYVRGYWNRKFVHDYYRRKEYLQKISERGQWTVAFLQREHAKKLTVQREDEEDQTREEFDNLAAELHHLVSTTTIPGVYNPPYTDALPRAFDKPIEQHLRDSCRIRLPRALRRPKLPPLAHSASPRARNDDSGDGDLTRHPTIHKDPSAPPQDLPDRNPHRSRAASAGRLQKVQGPFRSKEQIEVANAKAAQQFRSIQSAAPYSAVEDDMKMQERLAKLMRVSPKDFLAPSSKMKPPPPPSSVHAGAPYRGRPVELRGDVLELPKIRDKPPFFTAMKCGQQFEDYSDAGMLPNNAV